MKIELDRNYIRDQVTECLDVVDWSLVDGLYVTGSFANKNKDIDKDGYSDLDIEMVVSDWESWFEKQGDVSCYDGLNPAKIYVKGESMDYGIRKIDLLQSSEKSEDVDYIILMDK